jgi:hypothetical protein
VPERDIRLVGQQPGRAIAAGIVDDQEVADAKLAVMVQHERQALGFVANAKKAQDVVGPDRGGPIRNRRKLAAAAQRPHQQNPSLQTMAPCAQQG